MTPSRNHHDLVVLLGDPHLPVRPTMQPLAAVATGDVEASLREQVGPRWAGFASMSRERMAVVEALNRWIPGASEARVVCERAARDHAYETGVVLTLATACTRQGGASALGLEPLHDPVLRAILASRGRNVVLPEAFGPVAHWLAEKGEGRPLPDLALAVAADVLRSASSRSPAVPVERLGRMPAWAS